MHHRVEGGIKIIQAEPPQNMNPHNAQNVSRMPVARKVAESTARADVSTPAVDRCARKRGITSAPSTASFPSAFTSHALKPLEMVVPSGGPKVTLNEYQSRNSVPMSAPAVPPTTIH